MASDSERDFALVTGVDDHRTGEWTQDSEGFWRDADGYYVVAASDKSQGSTFTGSKGECKVYDSGCAAGTTDYYTGW